MFHNRTGSAVFVSIALCVLPAVAGAQQTVAADAFVDSAGVNIHLHYFTSIYGDFPLVRSRLIELGVRHVRDGLIDTAWPDYYTRFHSLAQAGIKGTFITTPDQSTELWASYPARMGAAFEAYEPPNEFDKSGDPNWAHTLAQTVIRMGTLKNDPRSARFPVLGPALTHLESYSALGDLSAHYDAANIHNYLGGRHPGTPGWGYNNYGSIAWSLNTIRPYAGGKPVIATENGYQDGSGTPDSIPQDIAGRYMPRLLLEQFRAGIARTYIYELIDWAPDSGNYGLLNQDGSPKPAFRAVKGLLNLLSDPGPAFTPQPLGYSVQGGTGDLHHMAFQKRDGTYLLALWLAVPGYDIGPRQHMAIATQDVTVTLPAPMRLLRGHRWQGDGSVSTASAVITTASFPVSVYDTLTVIELAPESGGGVLPGPPGVPGVPGVLSAAVYDRSVSLRWQAPIDGGAPSGYVIEASATLDFSNATLVPVGLVSELTAPNIAPGVYFVRVRAANAVGLGAPSNVAQLAVGLPAAPQLIAQQTNANPIALSWSGGAGADRYMLSAGSSPGASDLAVVNMGRATQIVAPVPQGVRFYVRVAAVNGYGVASSNEVSVIVGPAETPGAPSLAPAEVVGRHVKVTWAAGTGGAPHNYVLVVGSSPGAANLGVIPMGLATSIEGDLPSAAGPFFVRVFAQNGAGYTSSNEISFSVP
jgi:hypothetical protein